MARTAADVTAEEMEVYRATLRRREAQYQAEVAVRKQRARACAGAAAAMLRERYGATKVVLFGSLARDAFWLTSDIDLMVWDVEDKHWLHVGVDAEDLCPGFGVDVVLAQDASERLASDVRRDGIVLV